MQNNESKIPVGAISEVHSSNNYSDIPLIGWKDVYKCDTCGALVLDIPTHTSWHIEERIR